MELDHKIMELDELRIRPSGIRPSGNSPYLQYARTRGHVAATMCVIQMQDECAPS